MELNLLIKYPSSLHCSGTLKKLEGTDARYQMDGFVILSAGEGSQASEQHTFEIFRLRFAPLKMTYFLIFL